MHARMQSMFQIHQKSPPRATPLKIMRSLRTTSEHLQVHASLHENTAVSVHYFASKKKCERVHCMIQANQQPADQKDAEFNRSPSLRNKECTEEYLQNNILPSARINSSWYEFARAMHCVQIISGHLQPPEPGTKKPMCEKCTLTQSRIFAKAQMYRNSKNLCRLYQPSQNCAHMLEQCRPIRNLPTQGLNGHHQGISNSHQ